MSIVLRLATRLFLLLGWATLLAARPAEILAPTDAASSRSLNGTWTFRHVPSLDAGPDEAFASPAHDVSTWTTIEVPGHWDLQGHGEPRYGNDLQPALGLYRRAFRTDPAWSGQRIFLRFEGVLYGYAVYVNGRPVGEWSGGFNQATFDITDALAPAGTDNLLAVRVTTQPKGWEFDTMDCWALSGIYRDVTLLALPPTHLRDYFARTTLLPDGSAKLDIDFLASSTGTVTGRLLSPSGALAGNLTATLDAEGRGRAALVIGHPELWSAESPSLHRLELTLKDDSGAATQTYVARLGLRHVSIEDGILKLNGTPIKLRGVNHHEIWPEGRVSTDANTRRDLALIRDANINFVRTAHYPPHPRLLDLCDELGLYVLDEVPFIHGRQHLSDPTYQEILYSRARSTVSRDKNHASVLFWSIGNENPINDLGDNAGRLVKQLDPTRPIMFPTIGSYFAANHQKMSDVGDIYSPHYPPLQRARNHAATLNRPIIFTEYAHQRGLARTGTAVQDLWELFYRSPRIAGGAVWMFQDQGLLRTAEDPRAVPDGDLMVWLDDHRYYDTRGFFAMDGLVYSDRTPQVDYWLVRKVYSPVQIKGGSLTGRPGAPLPAIEVENRHDFRSLAGFRLHWLLRQNRAVLREGVVPLTARAKETEWLTIPTTMPEANTTDVLTLELRCEDPAGHQLHERTLRLDASPRPAPASRLDALGASQVPAETTLDVSSEQITVKRPGYTLRLDRASGQLVLLRSDDTPLIAAFGPHTGRNPTINDLGKKREREPLLWRGSVLENVRDLETSARRLPEGVELAVRGTWPRPGKADESVRGGYRLLMRPDGRIDVSYDYALANATGELLEAGFALAVPDAQTDFRWLGQGPYASYPGKDRHVEYGLFQLHRDDLYFPGNRRSVELACLTSPSGPGILVAGTDMTVDLEKTAGLTVLSHLAAVPGANNPVEGGETVDLSARLQAATLKTFAGAFTLLPLSAEWPAPLQTWFGPPSARVPVLRPFLRSYDQ